MSRVGLPSNEATLGRALIAHFRFMDLRIHFSRYHQPLFQKLADRVADADMHFLHPRRRFCRYTKRKDHTPLAFCLRVLLCQADYKQLCALARRLNRYSST